jgi:spore coat protein U-like protein
MAGATNGGTLAYSLNLSSTGAIPVTSGTEILSSSTLTFTANGTQQSLPVYGQITQAAAAAAAADSYTDSVTVTFTY